MTPHLSTARSPDAEWSVEAWRGIAALMVVCAHFQPLAAINVPLLRFTHTGVDLFFVLSGYVFAPYFMGRKLFPVSFAIRRFFRIYPAYVVALAVYIAMKYLEGAPLRYVWEHLTFTHLQSRQMTFYYNPPFWSLPAEVEFYLLIPLLALASRSQAWRLVALAIGAMSLRIYLGQASNMQDENRAYIWLHHLPGIGIEFMLGIGASLAATRPRLLSARLGLLAAGISGWLGLATLFALMGDAGVDQSPLRGQMGWLSAVCFAMMIASTGMPSGKPNELIARIGLWAGRLSYGTYLLHIAAFRLVSPYAAQLGPIVAPLSALTLTLGAAWLLHRGWEEPWRQFGRRLAARTQARNS